MNLLQGSPAVNKGNNAALAAGITTDITGQLRIQNSIVDMGAYESSFTALPLALLEFTGRTINQKDVLLQWRTAREIGVSHCELQRSTDDRSFATIANVAATGTMQTETAYSYTDKDISEGIYYYRLKMVDIDGAIKYSPVVMVVLKGHGAVTLCPVPTKNVVWLKGDAASRLQGKTAVLMNAQGKVLQRIRITQWPQKIDVAALVPGVYFLKVEELSFSFIKQ